MPDLEAIKDSIDFLLKSVFGDQVPQWASTLATIVLVIIFVLVGIWGALFVFSKIKNLWKETFGPWFYKPEEKRRSEHRRRFADHVEHEIRRLNSLEAWSDFRFTELEAEVEAEGRRRSFPLLPFLPRSRRGLRRERSLSKALQSSQERVILIEGDPGSGKSVALRHVAQLLAKRAIKARSTHNIIPIYVNLKELDRRKSDPIDTTLIKTFVLKSLNRANDRDIEEYLDKEFDQGLKNGTWLFLFDSFDELPEVLSSTEADMIIRNYGDAISDFLHGLNQCRGVIASRQFRGPAQFQWPRFRIMPLSEERRIELTRRADLNEELEGEIIGQLGTTRPEMREMVRNPMFLGLLCEYMRSGRAFPENPHIVFEAYVENRLTRDKERLQRRFKLDPSQVRATAEVVAFCMSADTGLGLSPTRQNIREAAKRLNIAVSNKFEVMLDALEFIKLARSETATAAGESKPFTFAHRRFQEYFATCVVLREPERVSSRQLLTDARWRETAVVMCQMQPLENLSHIIDEARLILGEINVSVPNLIIDPIEYVHEPAPGENEEKTNKEESLPVQFLWPAGAIHISGLLQVGFGSRMKELPEDIRMDTGRLILTASATGTLTSRKLALEVAGIVPQPVLLWLVRNAFASKSLWLRDIAYSQVARLGEITSDIAKGIRLALLGIALNGRLGRERHATHAYLSRLDKASDFLSIKRLLLSAKIIDAILHLFLFIVTLIVFQESILSMALAALVLTTLFLISFLFLWSPSLQNFFGLTNAITMRFFVNCFFVIGVYIKLRYYNSVWNTELFIVWLLLIIYAVLWTLLALLAAYTGIFTKPIWWGVYPVWPLIYFLRNFRKLLKTAFSNPKKSFRVGLALAVPIVIMFTLPYLIRFISELPKSIKLILYILIIVVYSIPIFLVTKFLLSSGFRWRRDWARWRKWSNNARTSMTGQEFLKFFGQYETSSFCTKFIRTVREQGLIDPTDETLELVEAIAVVIERDQKMRMLRARKILANSSDVVSKTPEQVPINLIKTDSFNEWYESYIERNKWEIGDIKFDLLDEISKLLEQTRVNRKVGGQ